MADATVLRLGGKNVKDVAGYGLIPLLVGSQGTLGLMTEATLRLRPAPPPRATMLAFFPTLESAGDAVAGLTAAGLGPVTLELMDRFTIRAVDDVHKLGLDRDAAAMLLVESDLPGGAAAAEMDAAEPVCEAAGATLDRPGRGSPRRPTGCGRAGASRTARSSISGWRGWRTSACRGAACPEMLTAIEAIADRHRLAVGTFGHAGDGNLHPTFVLDRDEDEAASVPRLEAARNDLYEAALALGGTVTGEHGIGVARREWLVRQRGEDAVAVMRAIKHALDPKGLLNPGRVLA